MDRDEPTDDGHSTAERGRDGTSTLAAFPSASHGDGIADVRVVVYRGYPIVALVRLPTESSGGSVSFHRGAVGVRLAVADGTALGACHPRSGRELTAHPDTGAPLVDRRIPNWGRVVEAATRAAPTTGICYVVDLTLTAGNSPVVLHVDSRPGLALQGTSECGLFRRLRFVTALPTGGEELPIDRRLARVRDLTRAEYSLQPLPAGDDVRLASSVAPGHVEAVDPGGQA
ncbi:sugar-transfer associated ATP-grasp domain-containing protein [Salinigranum marinum]|uniref:sugar-transfer associated ATP-grasp domain-containing protein n=1 Tax=Salinigranum marinum TaxID=1515595 RepID=UPI002989C813|nr:sugar-transfer associated ATP-grasp domain-containing protein [Salinigranum marinum]